MKFEWTSAGQESFRLLNGDYFRGPILAHFNPDSPTKVETDVSNFAKSSILSQLHTTDNKSHLVGLQCNKFNQAECNYNVLDKKLGVIVACFKE